MIFDDAAFTPFHPCFPHGVFDDVRQEREGEKPTLTGKTDLEFGFGRLAY